MTDLPDAAVEAEVRAMHRAEKGRGATEDFWSTECTGAHVYYDMARAALAAALPHLIAAEREACARVADDVAERGPNPQIHGIDWLDGRHSGAQETAAAIRARKDVERG